MKTTYQSRSLPSCLLPGSRRPRDAACVVARLSKKMNAVVDGLLAEN
jgi:hypothetical protein